MTSTHTTNSFSVSKARSSSKVRKRKNYVEEKDFKNVSIKMKSFHLFFNDEIQEKQFRLHSYIKSRTVVRLCIFGLILVSLMSFLLDHVAYQYTGDVFFWRSIIRGAIQLPLSLGWFIFTFRKERPGAHQQRMKNARQNAIDTWYEQRRCCLFKIEYWIIGCISASIIAMCILCQTILSREPDHGIYMLYFFMIYLFVGIPFFFAFLITWSTYFIFLISLYSLYLNDNAYFSDEYYNLFQLSIVYLCLTNILLTVAAYSLERGERKEFIHGMELNHQQKIIEGLLHNLLPVHVTDKLRNVSNNDYMIAEQVQECTILFSDMVAFTKWASTQDADVLIQRLHELYACFDDLCLLHRVYKVETIGDAYFVSSNCPIMAPDHSDRCLMLGKHMMIECKKLSWSGYTPRMRIGIHTGPVMAGVVGRKMPRYHLFGATVLIAEELESSGKPDYLHISHKTKTLISRNDWKLEDRGPKQVLHGSQTFHTYLVDLTHFLEETEKNISDL
eukprot:110670_1